MLTDFIPGMQGGALEETHKNETSQHMASPSSNTLVMVVTVCVYLCGACKFMCAYMFSLGPFSQGLQTESMSLLAAPGYVLRCPKTPRNKV